MKRNQNGHVQVSAIHPNMYPCVKKGRLVLVLMTRYLTFSYIPMTNSAKIDFTCTRAAIRLRDFKWQPIDNGIHTSNVVIRYFYVT